MTAKANWVVLLLLLRGPPCVSQKSFKDVNGNSAERQPPRQDACFPC